MYCISHRAGPLLIEMSKLEHPSLVSWAWFRRTPAATTRTRPSCPCARAAPPPTTGCCAPPPPGTMTSLRSWTHHPPHCIGILDLPKIQYSPFPSQGACGCGTEPNPPDFWTKAKVVGSVTINNWTNLILSPSVHSSWQCHADGPWQPHQLLVHAQLWPVLQALHHWR